MGLDVRQFNVEAVIFGDDFVSKAIAFEDILLPTTSGTLIHPHYGEIEVVVMSSTRRHSNSMVGAVPFTISFEKYGAPRYPSANIDTASELLSSSQNSYISIEKDFSDNFKFEGLPEFVTLDALHRINKFTGGLDNFSNASESTNFNISDFAVLPGKVNTIFKNISDFAKPFFSSSVGTNILLADNTINPLIQINGLLNTSKVSLIDASVAATNNQSVRIKNANSLDLMFKSSAITSAVSTARFATYESRDQATSYKGRITDIIDNLSLRLADNGWDNTWRSLNDMNAAITRDINERVGRLPYTLKVKPVNLSSSLAISNHLYGDNPADIITSAQDIVTRNKIRHPGFVPAKKLKVLINA